MAGSKVDRALRFSVAALHSQKRKGASVPSIARSAGVALLLARAGADDDVIAAGLLRPTVVEAGLSLEQLAQEFGLWTDVIVGGCTQDGLQTAPPAVKMVVCAEHLYTVRAMREEYETIGEELWTRVDRGREEQGRYYWSALDRLRPASEDELHTGLFRELEAEVAGLFDLQPAQP